jgi:hypothetical protein
MLMRYTNTLPTVVWLEAFGGAGDYGKAMSDFLSGFPTSMK